MRQQMIGPRWADCRVGCEGIETPPEHGVTAMAACTPTGGRDVSFGLLADNRLHDFRVALHGQHDGSLFGAVGTAGD